MISAADMAYATCALLEDCADANGPIYQFYNAWDSLDRCHIDKLRHGLKLSIGLQQAILGQSKTLILEKRVVTAGPFFAYAILNEEDTIKNKQSFCQPIALTKLALFMFHSLRPQPPKMPILLASPSFTAGMHLLVGVMNTSTSSSLSETFNTFGRAFVEARLRLPNAHVVHDRFDSSVMEIASENLSAFIKALSDVFENDTD